MNTNKKITKAMRFEEMANIFTEMGRTDLADFCNKQIELLAKKNVTKDGEKKLTATQKANITIGNHIVDHLANFPDRLFTITDLIKEIPICSDLTNQKVSAIVRNLIGTSVERIEEKNKAYFRYLA